MNKVINQKFGERGITLIALIVMIVIIVIIASVSIANLAGRNNLIDVTADVAQNYEVTSYKEQIEQVMHACIIGYSARGEVPTLNDMADALNEQDWVRSAIANTDTSISNGDIIVIVDKGYIFQVFYDSVYGKIDIDYIGKVPEGGGGTGEDIINSLPTVKARYEKSIASIIVEASEPKNGIEKIELIYKGKIVETRNNPKPEERFDIRKYGSGRYQVKATAKNTGAYRYAWVNVTNVSQNISPAMIALTPKEANGKNGWYTTPVNVNIKAIDENEIHYRIVRNGITAENEADITYGGTFTIDTIGQTKVYAWTVNGEGEQSEESEAIIKIDNIPPTITSAIIKGTEGENRWIISNAEIQVQAEDNIEGQVEGYTYEVYNMNNVLQKTSNGVIPISRNIQVETDGEWKILVKVQDKAGNISGEKLVEIHKDTEIPRIDTPIIENITARGFRIRVSAGDVTSGVARFEYYINGTKHGENEEGIYEVSGLSPNTNYAVEVKVYDNAGLSNTSNSIPIVTNIGLQAPRIDPTGTIQNGYYKGTITVNISEAVSGTGMTRIKYKLNNGAEQTINGTSGSFTIEQDGTHQIEAWTEDNEGNRSTSANANVTRDTAGPTVSLNVGTPTETTIPVTANATDTVSRNSKL